MKLYTVIALKFLRNTKEWFLRDKIRNEDVKAKFNMNFVHAEHVQN